MTKFQGNKMTDSDDEFSLPKDSPLVMMIKEDLEMHSVEVLRARLVALRAEINRTEHAIVQKGDAKTSAESFFK